MFESNFTEYDDSHRIIFRPMKATEIEPKMKLTNKENRNSFFNNIINKSQEILGVTKFATIIRNMMELRDYYEDTLSEQRERIKDKNKEIKQLKDEIKQLKNLRNSYQKGNKTKELEEEEK